MTPKQQRFVDEYGLDCNATQAAIRAGYSKANADKIGSQLLGKTRVAEAIKERGMEMEERTRITTDWVLQRLAEEAQFTGEGATHGARVQALATIGKHLGMFIERHEHTVTGMSDAERADRLVAILESARQGGTGPAPGERAN